VVIAMAILVIGMSAMAALSFAMLGRGRQSKYMSLASTLASEKLEDLNHWQGSFVAGTGTDNSGAAASLPTDPQICVPSPATSEGSLSVDTTTSITSGTSTQNVNYFDNVNIDVTDSSADCSSGSSGCFAETTSSTTSGTTTYYTTYHSPNGTVSSPPVQSAIPPSNMTFHRRWVIEANPTVNGTVVTGLRRITVFVTLTDTSVSPGVVNFQMSVVRP
jgi:hypothetical protein